MVLRKLAISSFLVRKVRTALTVAAIALSVSLVVSVTSGYSSMEESAKRWLSVYMGAYDAILRVNNDAQGKVPADLVAELDKDPAVREAVGRLAARRALPRASSATMPDVDPSHVAAGALPAELVNVDVTGVEPTTDSTLVSMPLIEGKWFATATGNDVVIDQAAVDKLGIKVGDDINLPGANDLKVHVIGLVKGKPTFFAQNSAPVIYVPLETLQHFTGQDNPPVVSRIGIYLKAGTSFDDFKTRWTDRLANLDTNLVLQMKRDSGGELERNLWSIRLMSYLGGVVSMLTAMFITFSALSMGVTERQRSLAMLRAIGGTRSQVFRLVLLEGFVLSLIGLVIGILLGILWINLLCWKFAEVFSAGAVLSIGGIIFASVGASLTAVAASILPAWSASRVDPLEAMNAHAGSSGPAKAPVKWALIGLPLIAIDPFLFFGPIESIVALFHVKNVEVATQYVRLFGHFVVGLPGIVFGLFFMAPLVVWTIDKIASWSIATMLRMPVALIRQQLSSGIWRAAGTGAALMVGLGTLIVMQVQGHTLIGGWRLPDKFPDIFIWGSDIISWQDQQKMGSIPGVEPGTLMPVVVTTPAGDSKTSLVIAAALSGGKNPAVMFFAVDPQQALGLIDLEFRDNDGKPFPPDQQAEWRAKTVEEMKKGRRIIVTEEFRQARHLKIGDPFPVQTSRNGLQTYTICGIVWSPGVDVIVSMYDVERVLDQQTVGSVFGSIDDAKNDFGAGGARLFAANLRGVDKTELLKEVQKSLGDRGLQAGDIRQIKYQIESTFFRILTLMSTVAFAALAVASLGVTNTIMASVRTRRWQFGVLRSVGVTRSELVRLVLAEAILLGIVGVVLGVAAGAETSVDARELSRVVLGYSPPFQIPWLVVGIGCCSVMLVAMLASFWPAMNVAFTEPLDLLQAGRASA